MRREIKHGKHDQSSHGRRGRAGKAGKAAFDASRAAGGSLADARAAGRAATAAERAKMKAEAGEARSAKLRSQAAAKRREAESGQVSAAKKRRLLEDAERLEARARGEKVGPRGKPKGAPLKGDATPVLKFDSPYDADMFMRDRMRTPLSEDELIGIRNYQGSGYVEINGFLRFGNPSQEKYAMANVPLIDSAMRNSRTKDNLLVHRGMWFPYDPEKREAMDRQLQVGAVFVDKGFLSTTFDPNVRDKFGGGSGISMNIRVPAGTPAVYMNSYTPDSSLAKERELLVNRDTPLRIISRRVNANGAVEVDAEIIPQ